MRERGIGAAILVPVVVVVFLLGQPWLTFGVAALALLAALEASRLLRGAGLPVEAWIIVIGAPLAVLGALVVKPPVDVAGPTFVAVIVVAAIAAFRVADVSRGFTAWMATTFGAFYVGLLAFVPGILAVAPAVPSTAPLGGVLDSGRLWLLLLVLTVWSFDTAAYLTGRTYGRGSFLAHISPSKTWSGVIGGTVAAAIVCAVLAWALGQQPLGGLLLGRAHRRDRAGRRRGGVDAQARGRRQGLRRPDPGPRRHPRPRRLVPVRRAGALRRACLVPVLGTSSPT